MTYGDVYLVAFDPHNLVAGADWTYLSQMKNDPNKPTQQFYAHSGTLSLDKKLYAINLIDTESRKELIRVYDLEGTNGTELFSEIFLGTTLTDEEAISGTQLKHNIFDQSLTFISWPFGSYLIMYITDLIDQSGKTQQEVAMMEYQTTEFYYVYLNLRSALRENYTLDINAANTYNKIDVNDADLKVHINLNVD